MPILPPSLERGKSGKTIRVPIPGPSALGNGFATVDVTGSHVWIVSTPCKLRLRIDDGSATDLVEGCGLSVADGLSFSRLEVENTSLAPIVVELYVGFAQFRDARKMIMEAYTVAIAQPMTKLAANASVLLTGVPSGALIQRKRLMVSNGDPAARVHICDTAGNILLPVFQGTTAAPDISGPVLIKNPNATEIECYISEIWFARS